MRSRFCPSRGMSSTWYAVGTGPGSGHLLSAAASMLLRSASIRAADGGAMRMRCATTSSFIGRASRGFDFVGYRLTVDGIEVSEAALERRDRKVARLYEQGAGAARIERYLSRWQSCAQGCLRSWLLDRLSANVAHVQGLLSSLYALTICAHLRPIRVHLRPNSSQTLRFGHTSLQLVQPGRRRRIARGAPVAAG